MKYHQVFACFLAKELDQPRAARHVSTVLGRLMAYAAQNDDVEAMRVLDEVWFPNDKASVDSDEPTEPLIWSSDVSVRDLVCGMAYSESDRLTISEYREAYKHASATHAHDMRTARDAAANVALALITVKSS